MTESPFNEETTLVDAIRKLQSGDLTDAADLFQDILNRNPSHPDALHFLGLTAYQLGQVDAARHLIHQAVKVKDPFPDAMANLGSVYRALGDTAEAETWLRKALENGDPQPAYWFNLGNVLSDSKRHEDSAEAYKAAIDLNQHYPEAWNGLGVAQLALNQVNEARAAFKKAVDQSPSHPEALYNLAGTERETGNLDEAEALLRQCVEARSGYALAWNALGNVLADQGRSEEALSAFVSGSDWAPEDARIASNVLSAMQYVDPVQPKALLDKHVEWMWLHHPEAAGLEVQHTNNPEADRPLRLGFVSPDFGFHPVGYFLHGLWPVLNSTQFSVSAFSLRPPPTQDEMTQKLKASAAQWLECADMDDAELAAKISSEQIDILFDLSGHTGGHRLGVFATKPAPIQISWLGYVGTTGLATMDYVLGDSHHLPDEAEDWLTEKPLRMPNGYALYTPPEDLPAVNTLPASTNGLVTFGCLNNPAKLSPSTLQRLVDVLKRVENSQLLIKFRGLDAPGVKARLLAHFAKAGLDPERILIEGGASRAEFLTTYNRIDIALDTGPYSGGLTTCEALWMGVPVITLPGVTFAGRHSLSYLMVAGLTQCIAKDNAQFVDAAAELAADLEGLAKLRSVLREKCTASPVGHASQFAEDFERLMRDVWTQWCLERGS